MNKLFAYVSLFVCLIVVSCSRSRVGVEPGVSLELAGERKAAVADVRYDLAFKIDSALAVNPEGRIEIRFDYTGDDNPLVLDFEGDSLGSVNVNGKDIANPEWREGHIIVEPEYLRDGENVFVADFTSAARALNRNPGYMYTLFVPNRAHSVFPCFDQPDMKASYCLELTVPYKWKAVSNSRVQSSVTDEKAGTNTIKFEPTEPLSSYLFAFAAGEFDYREHTNGDRTIGAYFRETDRDRLEQLDEIFSQVESSLSQLEEYTGIKYPFAKYDLVILPGFQFGGMEHTGATFYNDNTVFVGKNATASQLLSRAKLIAHETAHMWFGDFVTMEWFNDVWTKEVFANYFAAMLTRKLLPQYDHDLEWLRVYMAAALDQDRSQGSTPIRQQLDNLRNAGLIYNNIIYNKSPLMMGKLAELVGDENFKKGIRKYLSDHAYGNATWDDLVEALSEFTEADVEGFSRAWVYEKGMPGIDVTLRDGQLNVTQNDPYGRGIVWPQTFNILMSDGVDNKEIEVSFDGRESTVTVSVENITDSALIIPVADGRAYGLVTTSRDNLKRIMEDWMLEDGVVASLRSVGRLATLMMLNENYLAGNIETASWLEFLLNSIAGTSDTQMLSALSRYAGPALLDLGAEDAAVFEDKLKAIAETHPEKQARTLALKMLISYARSPKSSGWLYELWSGGESPVLSKDDFTDMSIQLALLRPSEADCILAVQRERISGADRLRKFDFVSRAAVSDTVALDSLFESLRIPQNRLVEPWTLQVISLLNHPTRHERSVKYIRPALEMLPDIQATGDIFFPANWSTALLGSYRSPEAAAEVTAFFKENQDMTPLLLNKVRQAAARLSRP
ncbi:MAG: aminopeptidase [Bacteroidales bacterium]|nr:aminopeptidase [Bacteroidales bacterium]